MNFLSYILIVIFILGINSSAHAYKLKFSEKIYPNPITLNCVASESFTDVQYALVDKFGKILKATPGNNLTERVQDIVERMNRLVAAGYRLNGPIETAQNGRKIRKLSRSLKVTMKLKMDLELTIQANREGGLAQVKKVKLHQHSIETAPSGIRNKLTRKTENIVGNWIKQKEKTWKKELNNAANTIHNYKVEYTPEEKVFDVAFEGMIPRDVPVSYCNKDRAFKIRINWDRRFNEKLGKPYNW